MCEHRTPTDAQSNESIHCYFASASFHKILQIIDIDGLNIHGSDYNAHVKREFKLADIMRTQQLQSVVCHR